MTRSTYVTNVCKELFSDCSDYLQRAEHTGEILLPAASHTLLSPQFLKYKKVFVSKKG